MGQLAWLAPPGPLLTFVSVAGAGSIATRGLAPSSRTVLAGIEIEPVAFGAPLQHCESIGCQQIDGGRDDRRDRTVEIRFVGNRSNLDTVLVQDEFLVSARSFPVRGDPTQSLARRATAPGER